MNVISLENIKKSYIQGGEIITILNETSLKLDKGEVMTLMGPSGCGKSSLLHIAGLLDEADSGKIIINNQEVGLLSDNEKSLIRGNNIGFVYQFHHLLPDFNALENLIIPQLIMGKKKDEAEKIAKNYLELMKLSDRENNFPSELSGGECQRVAIARALVNDPNIILADEPTGNLDPEISEMIFDLLLYIAEEKNIACLIVTHNEILAKKATKTGFLRKGEISY